MIDLTRYTQLGDISTDLQRLFALIPGGGTVAQKFEEFKALIRGEAEKGAMNAVPTIRLEVKKTVMPYVVASLALGFTGLLVGIAALRRAGR